MSKLLEEQERNMDKLSLQNPVFATYLIAATLMIPKGVGMSWLTVYRMTRATGGYRSPEDRKRTRLNSEPNAKQDARFAHPHFHQLEDARRGAGVLRDPL